MSRNLLPNYADTANSGAHHHGHGVSIILPAPPQPSSDSSSRTPAATTVCLNGGGQGVTVTVNRGNPTTITQTNLVYQTTQVSGTVWVGYVDQSSFSPFRRLLLSPLRLLRL